MAPIPCAAHVPPRCRGRAKSVCESHAGLTAAIIALHPKTEFKTAPRAAQNVIQRHPKPMKIDPGGTQAPTDATKNRPRAAKRQPKHTQKRSRDGQERPRDGQEQPQNGQNMPRRPQGLSKIDPGTPQDVSWARFLQKRLFDRLWNPIFDRFSCIMSKRKP